MPPLEDSRHERLCFEIVSGCSHAEAARRAGYAEKNARHTAYGLLWRKDVTRRIKELRAETASERVLSILERKAELSDIAQNEQANRPQVAIAAIAELNRMDGAYAPTKTETINTSTAVRTMIVRRAGENPEPLVVDTTTPLRINNAEPPAIPQP